MIWASSRCFVCTLILFVLVESSYADVTSEQKFTLHIERQPFGAGMRKFSEQTGMGLWYSRKRVPEGTLVNPVNDECTADQALQQLLAGTGISYTIRGAKYVELKFPPASRGADDSRVSDVSSMAMPEILVNGSNREAERTAEDPEPSLIITDTEIAALGQRSLVDVLMLSAPALMTSPASGSRLAARGAAQIRLHGGDTNETLILINGRRTQSYSVGGAPLQPELDSIPIQAVKQIEILSMSASGRYGGDGSAGVVNIVLHDDFEGLAVKLGYGAAIRPGSDARTASILAGDVREDFGTRLLFAASLDDEEPLFASQRTFAMDARTQALAHDSGYLDGLVNPPLGQLPNIRSKNGTSLGAGLGSTTSVLPGSHPRADLGGLRFSSDGYDLGQPASAQEAGARDVLRDGTRRIAAYALWNQELGDRLSGFVEMELAESRVKSPMSAAPYLGLEVIEIPAAANPFGQDILASVTTGAADDWFRWSLRTYRSSFGFVVRFPNDWRAELEYGSAKYTAAWSQPTGVSVSQAVAAGRLNLLQDTTLYPLDLTPYLRSQASEFFSTSRNFTLRFGGPMFSLPAAGRVVFSGGVERRNEELGMGREFRDDGVGTPLALKSIFPGQHGAIKSAWTQFHLPLLASEGRNVLDLTMAGRLDEYEFRTGPNKMPFDRVSELVRSETVLHSGNYALGLKWSPVPEVLQLRASAGTAFLPPSVIQLSEPVPRPLRAGAFNDLLRGGEPSGELTLYGGGDPKLRPAQSKSNSFGVIYKPSAWPGATLTIDRIRIHKVDGIISALATVSSFQELQERFPERFTRAPPEPNDPYGVGPVIAVHGGNGNLAESWSCAWDASLSYTSPEKSWGQIDLLLRGTRQTSLKIKETFFSTERETVGLTANAPLPVSAVGLLTLRRDDFQLSWITRYFGHYQQIDEAVIRRQGATQVASQIYHTLSLSLRLDRKRNRIGKTYLQITVGNLIGTPPPYDAGARNGYSRFGDPRLRTYTMSVLTEFD